MRGDGGTSGLYAGNEVRFGVALRTNVWIIYVGYYLMRAGVVMCVIMSCVRGMHAIDGYE